MLLLPKQGAEMQQRITDGQKDKRRRMNKTMHGSCRYRERCVCRLAWLNMDLQRLVQ